MRKRVPRIGIRNCELANWSDPTLAVSPVVYSKIEWSCDSL